MKTNELEEFRERLKGEVDYAKHDPWVVSEDHLMMLAIIEELQALRQEQTVTANTTAEIAEDLSVCRQDIEQLHEDVCEVIAQIGIAK